MCQSSVELCILYNLSTVLLLTGSPSRLLQVGDFEPQPIYFVDMNMRRYLVNHQQTVPDLLFPREEAWLSVLKPCARALCATPEPTISKQGLNGLSETQESNTILVNYSCDNFCCWLIDLATQRRDPTSEQTTKDLLDILNRLAASADNVAKNIEKHWEGYRPLEVWGAGAEIYNHLYRFLLEGESYGG